MKVRFFFLCSILAFGTTLVHGYELATHGRLTEQAFLKSNLEKDAQLLQDIGIDANSDNPFGNIYYDMSGSQVQERVANAFDKDKGRMRLPSEALTAKGWLMRGAIREDDLGQVLGVNNGGDPHDDPYGNFFRVFNHFYDPVRDRPLTKMGVALGQKTPDWATGSAAVFTQPNTPDVGRRNHFTVFDAREAMYRALTGRDSQGNVMAATEAERNKYWATTFRALGDVSHLVQDMGQPQHTRNDLHSGVPGFGEKSTFEAYIEARATGADNYSIDGSPPKKWDVLKYGGYDVPKFAKYSDYWSTREGSSGRGLADYSNRGFFSAGTNLGSNPFALPSNNAANYAPEPVGGLLPAQPGTTINFLRGDVNDYNQNSALKNIRMTTESAFDAYLANKTIPTKTYSLNRFNYDDMANLLIPRAVAYTAGLVNYFFRGKLDYVDDPINAGKHIIKNLGTESITGSFTLYYDAADGKRYPVAGDTPNETWSNRTIDANQQLDNLSFTPPTNPAPKTSDVYMLVFKGDMGEEKAGSGAVGAVAAKLIQPVGATDYVAMSMPNPVPYRGVNIGVVDRGVPTATVVTSGSNPQLQSWTIKHADGTVASTGSGTWDPHVVSSGGGGTYSEGPASNWIIGSQYSSIPGNPPPAHWWQTYSGSLGYSSSGYGSYYPWDASYTSLGYEELLAADVAAGIAGKKQYIVVSDGSILATKQWPYAMESSTGYPGWMIPTYAFDSWNGGGTIWYWGQNTSSITGHGQLNVTIPEDVIYPVPTAYMTGYTTATIADYPNSGHGWNRQSDTPYRFSAASAVYSSWFAYGTYQSTLWDYVDGALVNTRYGTLVISVEGAINTPGSRIVFAYTNYADTDNYQLVNGVVIYDWNAGSRYYRSSDTSYTVVDLYTAYPVPPQYIAVLPATATQWYADWVAGVDSFNLRRRNWFKKNSDEFISALKTGFAPSVQGVTRVELQTGKLPPMWESQIKYSVANRYSSYPKDASNVRVGEHTRRSSQYSETAFSETVQSDTSANLTQTGMKVTQRVATLSYMIGTETRSTTITGTLTQTVTRHNDGHGNPLLSRSDAYSNWYNREAGVPVDTATWAYTKDSGFSGIGVVLNGTIQSGFNADSLSGNPSNPLNYELYKPPYPKAFNTITADTPDFIKMWHKEATIEYLQDGIGASNVLNDSALYGVTEIDITPVGLIANGAGKAAAGESVGIFSSGEDGTQVEIYGTAVYKFDWQTGALTFKQWNPLLDAGGNEVASKIVPLPSGVIWSSSGIRNAIITYKGLHWPDVIAALKLRDEDAVNGTFAYSKPAWYEVVKAVKAR